MIHCIHSELIGICIFTSYPKNFISFFSFYSDVKVVILGDAGVGKTTFIKRYIEGQFTENISVSIKIL